MGYGNHKVGTLIDSNVDSHAVDELMSRFQIVAANQGTTPSDVADLATGEFTGAHYLILLSTGQLYKSESGVTGTVSTVGSDSDGEITLTFDDETTTVIKLIQPFRSVDSVSVLKTASISGYDGLVLHVGGYSTVTAEGFNLVRDVSEDASGSAGTDWNDNGIVNDKLLVYDVDGHAWSLQGVFLKLTWLGAEDGSDVGNVFFYATTYLKSLAVDTVLDIDVYNCTSTVQPPVLNDGYNYHVHLITSKIVNNYRNITFTSGDTPLKYSGGSGAVAGVYAENIKIQSTDSQVVEIKGTCGCIFRGCEFRTGAANVVDFTNDTASGTFTEFARFESCRLYGKGIARFIRGDGNDSFHGCGFDENTVLNLTDDSEWIFQFGDGTNAETGRIIWYNALLSATMFYSGSNQLELIHDGTNTTSYSNFATISGQCRSEFGEDWCATLATNIGVYLAQPPMELTQHFSFYGCWITPKVSYTTSGAVCIVEGWREKYISKTVADGINSFYLGIGGGYFPMEVDVEFSGANYQYGYTIAVAGRPATSVAGTVDTVRNWRSFNTAGWGAVTFTMDTSENNVYVTPANDWSSAYIHVKMTIRHYRGQSTWISVDDQDTSVTEYSA